VFGAAIAAESRAILHHIHGLAFAPDGKDIVVPAHYGLALYREGRWTKAPGAAHDFMGFSMTQNAIYSSGHPAPGTPPRDPLGLVKSTDGGSSWQNLGLAGEADFHLMAAGYRSGAIYVINAERNSRMPSPGLYVTEDEGRTWKAAAAAGLGGQVTSIAAHPTSPQIVALGTSTGLYVSRDYGASFRRIGPAAIVTASSFDFDGKHIYFALEGPDRLHRIELSGAQRPPLELPPLGRDFVTYVAQNPAAPHELALATRSRNVYLSTDAGKTWRQIAREGHPVAVAQVGSLMHPSASGGQ
jgi:photosystem II stability/assembly factor-like uncharacterized protein